MGYGIFDNRRILQDGAKQKQGFAEEYFREIRGLNERLRSFSVAGKVSAGRDPLLNESISELGKSVKFLQVAVVNKSKDLYGEEKLEPQTPSQASLVRARGDIDRRIRGLTREIEGVNAIIRSEKYKTLKTEVQNFRENFPNHADRVLDLVLQTPLKERPGLLQNPLIKSAIDMNTSCGNGVEVEPLQDFLQPGSPVGPSR